MRTVNLKEERIFLPQYVMLRNKYAKILLTNQVTIKETEEWIKRPDVEVFGIVESDILMGAVILYVDRGGEIAFFARQKGKGYGSRLLAIAEDIARRRGLKAIWAQTLESNTPAIKVFEKRGFKRIGTSERKDNGVHKMVIFQKILQTSEVQ
jgi:ribosomal protein S18 acetylase RimI-like enzyme